MDDQQELFDVSRQKLHTKNPCVPAPIGTGPAGETCGSCKNLVRQQYRNGFYLKCELMRHAWTHGEGSDIRAKWAACREWSPTAP